MSLSIIMCAMIVIIMYRYFLVELFYLVLRLPMVASVEYHCQELGGAYESHAVLSQERGEWKM